MYKKILFVASIVLGLTSCNGDYTDWVQPEQNTQQSAQPLNVTIANAASQTIDIASLGGDSIQLVQFGLDEKVDSVKDGRLALKANDKDYNVDVDCNGKVAVQDLQKAIVYLYSPAPTERTVIGVVTATGKSKTTDAQLTPLYTPLKSGELTFVVKPQAPVIESAYYLVGTVNGWNINDQSYKLDNGGGDVYENSVFTCVIPAQGGENKFKVAPASANGSWDGVFGAVSGAETTMGGQISCPGNDIIIDEVANPGDMYRISVNMLEFTYTIEPVSNTEVWYLVGSCIGDGSWGNAPENIGKALIPLIPAEAGICSNVVNLKAGSGFKLIKTPGNWNDQWGAKDGGYVKNDGGSGNIEVDADGLYTVSLNFKKDVLTITPYTGSTSTYAIGIAGGFNGWSFQAITAVQGQEHVWYSAYDNSENQEGKFLIDGWASNWGSDTFPYGVGVQNGANIPVKAGSYTIVFNDITGQYAFISK